ncbi:MAG: hypothetical protein RI601_02595 [Desulfurivibrionaceae bacterium]|nr:hypothetical protein [Desulfurivibrionaceae bacterium]
MNYSTSTSSLYPILLWWLLILAAFASLSLLAVNKAGAEDLSESPSLVGTVTRISPEEGLLVIKSDDGKRHKLFWNEQTSLQGVMAVEEIKIGQKVKVWSLLEQDQFKAVKIVVLPVLGC